jgi:2-polyprenyl-3-methyl-5-hydroxy-6-metoxy-1,4-benzoquinol methylase
MQKKFGDGISWEQFAEEQKILPPFIYENTGKKEIIDILKKFLNAGKVLDCGCNIGRWANLLTEKGFEYTGIDQSQKAIDMAKMRYPNYTFIQGFLWDMTFKGEFDLAFCNNVLQHNTLQEKKRVLPKINQALKIDGYLFLNESTTNEPTLTQLTYEGWINLITTYGFKFLESWQLNQLGLTECYFFKKEKNQ